MPHLLLLNRVEGAVWGASEGEGNDDGIWQGWVIEAMWFVFLIVHALHTQKRLSAPRTSPGICVCVFTVRWMHLASDAIVCVGICLFSCITADCHNDRAKRNELCGYWFQFVNIPSWRLCRSRRCHCHHRINPFFAWIQSSPTHTPAVVMGPGTCTTARTHTVVYTIACTWWRLHFIGSRMRGALCMLAGFFHAKTNGDKAHKNRTKHF